MLEALKAYVAKLEEVLNRLSEKYDVSEEELEEEMYEFAVSTGDDLVCNAAYSIVEQGIEFLACFEERYGEGREKSEEDSD